MKRWAVAAVALALYLAAAPLWAVDAVKSAQSMAKAAQVAYEGGDYSRAEKLFLDAFRTDAGQPLYLYSAGRAAHVAGRLDAAEQHYRAYLGQSQQDPAYAGKAKTYLADIAKQRRDAVVTEAERAERAGQHSLASRLYEQALMQSPDEIMLLFRIGRALFRAGEHAAARVRLAEYLDRAQADAPDRAEATAYRDQLAVGGKPAGVPAPDLAVAAAVPKSAARWPGWAAAGAGVALGVAAGAAYYMALTQRSELDARLAETDSNGKISGISLADAQRERESIGNLKTTAAVTAGAAVVAGAIGTWLLVRAESPRVTAAPGQGLALAWQF